jgi:putative oxidoreductase
MDFGLLLLRLTVGLTLAAHGAQKLFGWFGGPGLEKTGQGLEMLGFAPGRRHAIVAGVVELGAGALLVLGLFSLLGASLVGAVMFVAAVTVHLRQGFFITSGGFEYNLVLGVAGLTLAFTGPGALSADALFGSSISGIVPGIGAVLIGLLGGAAQLAQRRPAPAQQPTTA